MEYQNTIGKEKYVPIIEKHIFAVAIIFYSH